MNKDDKICPLFRVAMIRSLMSGDLRIAGPKDGDEKDKLEYILDNDESSKIMQRCIGSGCRAWASNKVVTIHGQTVVVTGCEHFNRVKFGGK